MPTAFNVCQEPPRSTQSGKPPSVLACPGFRGGQWPAPSQLKGSRPALQCSVNWLIGSYSTALLTQQGRLQAVEKCELNAGTRLTAFCFHGALIWSLTLELTFDMPFHVLA